MTKSAVRSHLALIAAMMVSLAARSPAAAADSPAAPNLLPNPSFESGPRDAPDAWQPRAWQNTQANARWSVEPAGRTGRCVAIRAERGKAADAAWTARYDRMMPIFARLYAAAQAFYDDLDAL